MFGYIYADIIIIVNSLRSNEKIFTGPELRNALFFI